MEKKSRQPVLRSVLFTAVLVVVLVAAVLVANYFGIGTMRSALRVGYSDTESRQSWSASYTLLSGWMRRTLYPEGDVLQVEVKTDAGTLSMEMWDREGNLIFSQQDMNGVYQVPAAGKVIVKITAQDHRGSFSITRRPVAADNAHGDGANRSICWARPGGESPLTMRTGMVLIVLSVGPARYRFCVEAIIWSPARRAGGLPY